MYSRLSKLSDHLDMICKKTGAALLGVMVVLIVVQVAARYLAGSSLSWSEEISRYLFIWVVMLGAVIGVHDGSHVAVEIILKRLPPAAHKITTVCFALCLCVLAVVMLVYGSVLAAKVSVQLSPATRIPMSYVYAAIPACSLVMLVHLLVQLMRNAAKTTKGGKR